MPLTVIDNGTGNTVLCSEPDSESISLRVVFNGDGNRLVIGDGCNMIGAHFEFGAGCEVTLGGACVVHDLFVYVLRDSAVQIGDGASFNARVRLLLHEPSRIVIGDGCLFASDVDVMTSDQHSILDAEDGTRINLAADIMLERNVWVGQHVTVLKGAAIGHDSVIAAGAIVSGTLPPHVLAGGIPAKIIRSGIVWDRRLL